MSVQVIGKGDKPEYAVVPFEEWQRIQERLEDLEDLVEARQLSARVATGEDEVFSADFLERLLSGANPVTVWREHRGMTCAALAASCGVTGPAISQIESGKREPSVALAKRMAAALGCALDDLFPSSE